MKQLKEKEAELEKDKKMMKVLNLEKALAEKKLALDNLVEQKQKKAKEEEDAKEVAKREEMIASVLKMAKDVQSSKAGKASMTHAVKKVAGGNAKGLANVQSYLEGRMKTLSGNMKDLDAAQKKREDMIKATLGDKAAKSDDKELKKNTAILNMLMKKEQRNYKKVRATFQSEYKELEDAVNSIKKGDVAALSKVMSHMQNEMKAKSNKFLY